MKKSLLLFSLLLAFWQPLLSQAYQPKLLWQKEIGNQPGAAVISNDDKFIYCTEGSNLYKLDIDSGTILKQYNIGAGILRISNDDKILYMGTNQGLIVFDLEKGKILKRIDSTIDITSLDISPDNSKLCYWTFYLNLADSLKIYSLPDFRLLKAFRHSGYDNNYYINNAKFLPDNKRIVWCPVTAKPQTHANLEIYDITLNQVVATIINAHYEKINDIAISSDGLLIASAAADKSLKVWDINTKQTIFNKQLYSGNEIISLNFDHKNKLLLAGGNLSNPASIWNYNKNNKILEIDGLSYGTKNILSTKDDKKLFVFSLDMEIYELNVDNLLSVQDSIHPLIDILYPNPTTSNLNLSIILPTVSNYTINIENFQGNQIKPLFVGILNSGLNNLNFNVNDISNGTYFLKISSVNFTKTFKLIKE